MKKTPVSMRPHIGIFGKVNAGKSSLINALTGQNLAIVSETSGTTTDPVGKAMEILPLGPVYIIDTAGLDDISNLGVKRLEKTNLVLKRTDLILLVSTFDTFNDIEKRFIESCGKVIVVFNKADIIDREQANEENIEYLQEKEIPYLVVSAETGKNINELRLLIASTLPEVITSDAIATDLFAQNDIVIHVIPIDSAAPKGRIILPQEQILREALDSRTISICIQPQELPETLSVLKKKPRLVVTDSQAIEDVNANTPDDIPLTTYSILFSRLKGDLTEFVKGLAVLPHLQNGDKIMIAEACTHHSQPDDIGRVKIPKWLEKFTGKKFVYLVNSGRSIHQNLDGVKLIIQCGGCMINRREMLSRLLNAQETDIPITNYGVLISHLHNSLERTIEPFTDAHRQYLSMARKIV
jgi:[FeFe] hydrogenase H-cluster maturation GTPase HydF